MSHSLIRPCFSAALWAAALSAIAPAAEAQIAYGLGQAKIGGTQQFFAQGAGGSPAPFTTRLLDQTTSALTGPFVLGGPSTPPSFFVGAQASSFAGNPQSGCTYNLFAEVQNDLDYVLQGTSAEITLAISSVSDHLIDLHVFSQPHEGPQAELDVYTQQDVGRVVLFEVPFQLDQARTLQIQAGSLRLEEGSMEYGAEDVLGTTTLGWTVHADFGADGVFDGPSSRLFGSTATGTCDSSGPSSHTTSESVPAGAYFLRIFWDPGSRIEESIACPQGGGNAYVKSDAHVTETGCLRLTAQ